MTERSGVAISKNTLDMHGIKNAKHEYWNLEKAALLQMAIERGEGRLANGGPLVTRTGTHTGRAAKDKVFVREPSSEQKIDWGDVNKPVDAKVFDKIKDKITSYYQGRDLFVMDVYAGADEKFRLPVRVVTENAWHALFVDTMFIRAEHKDLEDFKPEFTVLHAPHMKVDPDADGVRSETSIVVNFGKNETLIAGTRYAGEIKKSVFGAMNYYLPERGVLTMHASANIGRQGRTEGKSAIFFGLSGTGKTTLSADQSRSLIGDDEHGWSDEGVFNIEGGCYAKVIRLDPKTEPEIFATTSRFGTVLENVGIDEITRTLDLNDNTLAENTRAAYEIEAVPNYQPGSKGGHPSDVVMLTADAFGVLPPISRLTKEQAMYWFLLGYTAKVAGTEMGVTEPEATFSACFGAPFMPLPPTVYAKMLGEKIEKHGVRVWLLNTGWTGGAYGTGKRMSLPYTRAMLNAALNGDLDGVDTRADEIFGLNIPVSCPNVPDDVLDPKKTWSDGSAYDAQAKALAAKFIENFKPYHDKVDDAVRATSPKL